MHAIRRSTVRILSEFTEGTEFDEQRIAFDFWWRFCYGPLVVTHNGE